MSKLVILEVRAADLAKAVGFFKFEDSEFRERWGLNLPSKICGLFKARQIEDLIVKKIVDLDGVEFNNIVVFDEDFDWSAYCSLSDWIAKFPMAENCSVSIPGSLLEIVNV